MKRLQLLKCLPSMELRTRFTQNPVTSDYMFPGTHHIQENDPNSTHLQMPSQVFIHQNSQHYVLIHPEHPTNIPLSVIERNILSASQQTFGQRKVLMHLVQHPNAFSLMECSRMSSTNELPPPFFIRLP
ncbi:hypothetical protein CEXT_228501 [Caerostris extrusa]|uniref:Uncharacterized protein n=1 Tax=Caerostris extrusa TaxID=172846 RepID=A0AAV4XYK9_CAEEX|nr:hypothetical protein CEXT_228501 [Caerostris extrusa]